MMKSMKRHTCTVCQKQLRWWSTQSCMKCGQNICQRHTRTIRRSYSSVLYSFCTSCVSSAAKNRVANPVSLTGVLQTRKTVDSLISNTPGVSFSGISLSGISFSGISLSGISLSGISQTDSNQEPDQIDDQPRFTTIVEAEPAKLDTNQPE